MALPSSGSLSFAQIRTELNGSGSISLGDSNVRGLAGKSSGAISFSDLRGKSSFLNGSASYNVNTATAAINGVKTIPTTNPAITRLSQITIANLSKILSCNFSLTFGGFLFIGITNHLEIVPGSLQLKIINASTKAVLASSVVATETTAVGTVLSAQVSLSTPTNIRLVIEPAAGISVGHNQWPVFGPHASSCTAIYTYQP